MPYDDEITDEEMARLWNRFRKKPPAEYRERIDESSSFEVVDNIVGIAFILCVLLIGYWCLSAGPIHLLPIIHIPIINYNF